MNIIPNTYTFNATPTFSSASGIPATLTFGEVFTDMGLPIERKFIMDNYITISLSNVNFVKTNFVNINFIRG